MPDEFAAHVYLFDNGMLVVFDDCGEQMPAAQGPATWPMPAALRAVINEATALHLAKWRQSDRWVSRLEFVEALRAAAHG